MKSYSIGIISEDHKLATNHSADKEPTSVYINYKNPAVLAKIDSIAQETYRVCFNIHPSNTQEEIKFSKALPGIEFFGKHFSIYSTSQNKTRYYSICLAMNKVNLSTHESALNYILNNNTSRAISEKGIESDSENENNDGELKQAFTNKRRARPKLPSQF